jgi:hypothetical protein
MTSVLNTLGAAAYWLFGRCQDTTTSKNAQ